MSDPVFAAFCAAGLWPGLGKRTAAELPAAGITAPDDVTADRLTKLPRVGRQRAERLFSSFLAAAPTSSSTTSYVGAADRKLENSRSARCLPTRGSLVSRSAVTSSGAVIPAAGSSAAVRRPRPGHRPAVQKAAKTGSPPAAGVAAAVMPRTGARDS